MSEPKRRENHMGTQDFIAYYLTELNELFNIDPANALVTIEYPHHEVHEGNFYTLSTQGTIAAGTATALKLFMRPGVGTTMHFQGVVAAKNSGWVQLWENVTYGGGAVTVPKNNDRTSLHVFNGTCNIGGTIVTYGTLLQSRAVGASSPGVRLGAEAGTRNEWIFNPNYWYMLWFIADNATTQISLDAEWYVEDIM